MDATAQELVARLRRDPDDAEAFRELRGHYLAQRDFASLANLLEGWADRSPHDGAASRALGEAAEHVLAGRGDPERALALLEDALERDPTNGEALARGRALLEDRGELDRLVELHERVAARLAEVGVPNAEVALFYHEIGTLWSTRLDRPDRALAYFRVACELDPELVPALYAAREILRASGQLRAAAALCEQEARAERDPARCLALYRELARLRMEGLDDPEGAIRALKRALALAPEDLETMGALAELHLARAERMEDPHVAAAERHRAADQLYHVATHLPVLHRAPYLERSLDLAPDHLGALVLYERQMAAERRTDLLPARWVAFLERRPTGPAAAERRFALADAYRTAGQTDFEVACLEALLEEGDPRAAVRLAELYRAMDRPSARIRALSVAAAALAAPESAPYRRELNALLEARGQDEAAAAHAAELRRDEPTHAGAARLAEDDPEARAERRRLLAIDERWDDLAEALEAEAARATERSAAPYLTELAELHLGPRQDPAAAADALGRIAELYPEDGATRDRLADALIAAGREADALPLLLTGAEDAAPAERPARWRTAARLQEKLGDAEGARRSWSALLREVPGDVEALGRKESLDLEAGRKDQLLETLAERARVAGPAERPRLLVRMGHLAEELGDLERASTLFTEARALGLVGEDVLDALGRVHEAAGTHRELVALLRAEAARHPTLAGRADLHRRVARVLGERLGDREGALAAWQEVLAAGEDAEALRFLRGYLADRGALPELARVLERLVDATPDDAEAVEAGLEAADLLADELGRPSDAAAVLRRLVRERAPAHVLALHRLAALEEAAGDSAGLADTLWRELSLLDEPGLRLAVARRLVELHEGAVPHRARLEEALEAWAAADPKDPEPRQRLAPLLEASSRWEELVRVLDEAARLGSREDAGRFRTQAAQVAFRRLGDVDGAWARLSAAIEHDYRPAEDELRALALGTGRAEALAELHLELGELGADPETQRHRWMTAAEVLERDLHATERALEAVIRALSLEPGDGPLLDEADRLAAASGAWSRLARVYENLVARAPDDAARAALRLRHAERREEAGDPRGALDETLLAARAQPHDEEIFRLAEARARAADRPRDLLAIYERRRHTASELALRVDALVAALRLSIRELHDRPVAQALLAEGALITAGDPTAMDRVEHLVGDMDRRGDLWRPLAEAYESVAASERARVSHGLLHRAARIWSEQLGDDRRAFDLLAEAAVIRVDPEVLDLLERRAEATGRARDLRRLLDSLAAEALDADTLSLLEARRTALGDPEPSGPPSAAVVDALASFPTFGEGSPDDLDGETDVDPRSTTGNGRSAQQASAEIATTTDLDGYEELDALDLVDETDELDAM